MIFINYVGAIEKILENLKGSNKSIYEITDAKILQFREYINKFLNSMMTVNPLWAVLIYSDMKFNFNFYDNTIIGILRRCIDQYNSLAEVVTMQIVLNNIFNTIGDDNNNQSARLGYFEKEFNKNFDNFNKVSFTSKRFDEYMFNPNSKTIGEMSEYYICTSVTEFYSSLLYLHFQSNKRINVCKLCGKLFTPKTAKATSYCYGSYNGQKCQDLGPHIANREQQKKDEVLAEFEKVRRKLYLEFYIEPDAYWNEVAPIIPNKRYMEFMENKKRLLADYRMNKISKEQVMKFLEQYK
ncbi:MAG: DUF6076 domain-containing protein [Acetobacter sp.]|nr:DUF6076 domain-containing protein [Bacteroides sp.]MCM1341623.1 DUF6076 domain-containing protein [Acetobacter sp.]MCM1434056.1 DUF6076 domain-containing protein [Clostridiales bacterium]